MYTGTRDCCSHYHGGPPPCVYVPVVWVPIQPTCCDGITVPRDLDTDPRTRRNRRLWEVPKRFRCRSNIWSRGRGITVGDVPTTTSNGAIATWSDTAPAVGYHVQEAVLLLVKAGTKVSLSVNNVTARLRWCERVCC